MLYITKCGFNNIFNNSVVANCTLKDMQEQDWESTRFRSRKYNINTQILLKLFFRPETTYLCNKYNYAFIKQNFFIGFRFIVYMYIGLYVYRFIVFFNVFIGFYNRITALSGPKTKVLLALGGWTDSTGDKYSKVVSSGTNRRKLVSSIVAFLRRYKFNGLLLDWNYPVCWHSDCNKGPTSDKPNFTKLIQVLFYFNCNILISFHYTKKYYFVHSFIHSVLSNN